MVKRIDCRVVNPPSRADFTSSKNTKQTQYAIVRVQKSFFVSKTVKSFQQIKCENPEPCTIDCYV